MPKKTQRRPKTFSCPSILHKDSVATADKFTKEPKEKWGKEMSKKIHMEDRLILPSVGKYDRPVDRGEYSCHHCQKVSASFLNHQAHIRAVHEPHRFNCPKCPRLFRKKRAMEIHILRDHFKVETNRHEILKEITYLPSVDLTSRIIRLKGEKRFQCPKCKSHTTNKSYLERHIKQFH